MRIGQGFDVHALVAGRKLVVGGVEIPFEKGLAGHSDADVLLHAIADALLGAAALGDIGRHFPDTDPALSRRGQPQAAARGRRARPGGGLYRGERRRDDHRAGATHGAAHPGDGRKHRG